MISLFLFYLKLLSYFNILYFYIKLKQFCPKNDILNFYGFNVFIFKYYKPKILK